jgi:hypothetical protein
VEHGQVHVASDHLTDGDMAAPGGAGDEFLRQRLWQRLVVTHG